MKKTDMTGCTCVGELRLPDKFALVGFSHGGKTWLVEGTREEMIAAIKRAGYRISN